MEYNLNDGIKTYFCKTFFETAGSVLCSVLKISARTKEKIIYYLNPRTRDTERTIS
jgi:hypothetical protein